MTNGLIIRLFNGGPFKQRQHKGQQYSQPITPLRHNIIQVKRLSMSTTGFTVAVTTKNTFTRFISGFLVKISVRNPLIRLMTNWATMSDPGMIYGRCQLFNDRQRRKKSLHGNSPMCKSDKIRCRNSVCQIVVITQQFVLMSIWLDMV